MKCPQNFIYKIIFGRRFGLEKIGRCHIHRSSFIASVTDIQISGHKSVQYFALLSVYRPVTEQCNATLFQLPFTKMETTLLVPSNLTFSKYLRCLNFALLLGALSQKRLPQKRSPFSTHFVP